MDIRTKIKEVPSCFDPTSGGVVTLKTGRREVPGSNLGRTCPPSRSELSRGYLRNSR